MPGSVRPCLNRKGGSHFDPANQVGNLSLGQRFFWRHLECVIGAADRFNQQAFVWLAGDDRCAEFSPAQDCRAGIEPQVPPLFFDAMTALAFFHQQRTDGRFKEPQLFGRRLGLGSDLAQIEHQTDQYQETPGDGLHPHTPRFTTCSQAKFSQTKLNAIRKPNLGPT